MGNDKAAEMEDWNNRLTTLENQAKTLSQFMEESYFKCYQRNDPFCGGRPIGLKVDFDHVY